MANETTILRIYRDKVGKFRWQLKAPNGKIIGSSTQGYASKRMCKFNYHAVHVSIRNVVQMTSCKYYKLVDDTRH